VNTSHYRPHIPSQHYRITTSPGRRHIMSAHHHIITHMICHITALITPSHQHDRHSHYLITSSQHLFYIITHHNVVITSKSHQRPYIIATTLSQPHSMYHRIAIINTSQQYSGTAT
jgi:hypothetical protein